MFRSSIVSLGLRVFSAVAIAGAIAPLFVSEVRAQSTTADPLEDFQTQDGGTNPFDASDGNGAQSGIYNLIHRMMLSNGTTMDEFSRQRQENISTEAESFRTIQLQRIQGDRQSDDPAPLDDDRSVE